MTKHNERRSGPNSPRFEFRVWGEHNKARKKLAKLATSTTVETFDDCYLLIDDNEWNAKVRDNTLKIKQLVSERKGFEAWSRDEYVSKRETPSPFDDIFKALKLDRPQRGKKYDIRRAVEGLDSESGVRAVFVTKERRRFEIGHVVAESTDITIADTDQVLHTLSVEGDDLKALTALRKELGLRDEENIAVHTVIHDLG